jgi:hypothetical protein
VGSDDAKLNSKDLWLARQRVSKQARDQERERGKGRDLIRK